MLFASLLGDSPVTAGAKVPAYSNFAITDEPAAGVVYSGVKFDSDGDVYKRQLDGAWQKFGTWLSVGANTAYHLLRTIDDGTLTTDGTDDIVMSSDLIYDVQVTASGEKTAVVTFTIVSTAGHPAHTTTYDAGTYSFSATMESP